jgi:hypothetical protein
MSLTREQKHRLAAVVITQVAGLFENPQERIDDGALLHIEDIDPAHAAQQISHWLSRQPGDAWDIRLLLPH